MNKILMTLFLMLGTSIVFGTQRDWKLYQNEVLSHQNSFEGWCTKEKAKRMMDLILETKPQVCVEIGVFGGASIYPTASALKFIGQGQVFAIDPWKTDSCLDGYTPDNPNYQWWNSINLEKIYRGFLKILDQFQLKPFCAVMKMTGGEALQYFENETIDILHIDGNHTENIALSDAQLYLPKIKIGGYIWLDDANWETTLPARKFLIANCEKDESRSTEEYYLFRKL